MKTVMKLICALLVMSTLVLLAGCQENNVAEENAEDINGYVEQESSGLVLEETLGWDEITGESDESEAIIEEYSGDTFVNSVAQKGAPTMLAISERNGESVFAIIRNENLDELETYNEEEVRIIPLSMREEAPEEVEQELVAAFKSIANANSLLEVVPDLDEALDEMGLEQDADDLVVLDLFHVLLNNDAIEMLEVDGTTITVHLDFGQLDEEDLLMFMRYENGNWEINDGSWEINGEFYVHMMSDGIATVSFEVDMGTLAVLVEKKAE